MQFLFWLALVIGGGLFLLSLAGDVFGVEGHDGHAFHAHTDTDWGRIFSLRNATYFLFAFGAVGVLLNFVWSGNRELIAIALAAVTGLAAWAMSYFAFGYLRRSDSGQRLGDELLVGRIGTVSLPILKGRTGKIVVARAGQTQELLAKPLSDDDDAEPETWESVIVVEVRDGVALVTPFTEEQFEPTKE
jgi:membrane protein implicated in regulation of membrane protease activity